MRDKWDCVFPGIAWLYTWQAFLLGSSSANEKENMQILKVSPGWIAKQSRLLFSSLAFVFGCFGT